MIGGPTSAPPAQNYYMILSSSYISKVGEKDYEDDLSSALLTHYYISKRSRGRARFSVVNINEQCKGTKYVRVLAWDCCLVFPLLPTNILWQSFDR